MPGRIGKTYPRLVVVPSPGAAPAPRGGLPYGVIGVIVAVLSALGVLAWLLLR